jgi:hypothetical protein
VEARAPRMDSAGKPKCSLCPARRSLLKPSYVECVSAAATHRYMMEPTECTVDRTGEDGIAAVDVSAPHDPSDPLQISIDGQW